MKNKNKKQNQQLKKIAAEIVALEKAAEQNPQEAMDKMAEIAMSLSIEDLLEIDEYISEKKNY